MSHDVGIFRSLYVLSSYKYRILDGVMQDVKQRYVGSFFGSLWAVIFPVLQLSIYTTLYAVVFRVRPTGLTEMGYVLLVFSGLVPLLMFSEALNSSTGSLVANKNLLLNTVFPAELLPLRAAMAAQISGMVGLTITLALGFSLGRTSWHAVLLIPVFWILLLMFATGLGWIFSLVTLIFRDIQHGLGLVIMLFFVLSPFAYTPDMMPGGLKIIIYLNPLSYFVLTFQKLIVFGTWPNPYFAGIAVVLGVGTFFTGFIFFQRAKHIFFDYA